MFVIICDGLFDYYCTTLIIKIHKVKITVCQLRPIKNMSNLKIFLSAILLLVCFLEYSPVKAQGIPQNFSNVNIDDLTDAQIRQYLDQARASGLTDDQFLEAAKSKGMSDAQIQRLQVRLAALQMQGSSAADTAGKRTSILNNQSDPLANTTQKSAISNKIFGSDLFRNASASSFEPNLKLATPLNYIVGPDDQLHVSIYGKSVAEWNLSVSPEGNINIPGIGVLNVSGKTIEQATESIKSKLIANRYSIGNGTTVQVSLGNIRSIKVIMQGQVMKPGAYTLSSFSTVLNALYAAGGPNDIGSFRKIEVIRNNRKIRTLDLYDIELSGNRKDDIGLKDQDIIRIPTYDTHVELSGEVKIPAIFEPLPGETLADIIHFAGGFTDQAYRDRIKVTQISGQQRKISDILESQYNTYIPHTGDKYIIDRILERFENRVTLTGAVFRPGQYELQKGLTLSQLIKNAAGLKEDAFMPRGDVIRLKADNTTEVIPFNVTDIVSGKTDIILQREDNVYISSIFDLRDDYTVSIGGGVRNGGTFPFAENMTVEDMIIKAGGFTVGASPNRIEVARRVRNSDPTSKESLIAKVFSINVDPNLQMSDLNFKLQPYDMISVYGLPGYETQRNVTVTGEVLYPGTYTIQNKNEKISDVLKRAGGLTASADPEGGTLKRDNAALLGADARTKINVNELAQDRNNRLEQLKRTSKDSTSVAEDLKLRNNYVGIDLQEILDKPGSKTDLILEEGDEIRIPKQQQIVKLNGEVLYPSAVVYSHGKGLRGYISNAGGFSSSALKRRVYVVYANGTVEATHKFLFFNVYPPIKAGSEIFVPKKIEKKGLSPQELLGITTGIASLGAIVLGIISLSK